MVRIQLFRPFTHVGRFLCEISVSDVDALVSRTSRLD